MLLRPIYARQLASQKGFGNMHLHRFRSIELAEHGHFPDRCKHIHLRWMFIRVSEFIDGILKLHQVPTTQQVADIGTKALPLPLFCDLLYIVFGLA